MMIDYKLLNYLSEQEMKRDIERSIKTCYITSKILLRYEQYNGAYTEGTFENLLMKDLPPLSKVHCDGEFISKNLMEYKITMPVELMPFYMETIKKIHDAFPNIRIENENIVWRYYWGTPWGNGGWSNEQI